MDKKNLILFVGILWLGFTSFSLADYPLYDFETETTGNWISQVSAVSVEWMSDPTGQSTGVLGVYLDSGVQQRDFMSKAYIYMQNQSILWATHLQMDVYFPDNFPTGVWVVPYIKQDTEWMQESAVGVSIAEADRGQWHRFKMNIAAAMAEWNPLFDQLLPSEEVGLLLDLSLGAEPFSGYIYIDNIMLIGVDTLFVVPPDPPSDVAVIATEDGINTITWVDETSDTGELYNVYVSESPITDVTANGVRKIGMAIPEGTQTFTHRLFSTSAPATVNYYYAVTSVNGFGDEITTTTNSNATASPVSNSTKQIAPVVLLSQTNITIDGELNEYTHIMPFILDSTSTIYETVDGDQDLSARVWVLLDAENLYFAAEVTDDQPLVGLPSYPYGLTGDGIEIYIGLYDILTTPLRNWLRPDAFNFTLLTDGDIYNMFFQTANAETKLKQTATGYNLEAKIPYSEFYPGYVPTAGITVPLDISVHDMDIMAPPFEEDGSLNWVSVEGGLGIPGGVDAPSSWGYTQILSEVTIVGDPDDHSNLKPITFNLFQNYPNPFNPETEIRFDLPTTEHVTLTVYNALGQSVRTLVDQVIPAGNHRLRWNGKDAHGNDVASGVYYYHLKAGNYSSTRKMLLLR